MTSQMNSNQELFLDILTKEEREALLTKKMEEIRKRNEALRKRHEEIEADRKGFDASQKRVSSPQKESKQFPEEVRKDVSAPADGRHKDSGRPRPKSAGRGRSPNKSHKDSQRAQDIRVIRTISGEERNTRNIRMLDESGGHNPQQKSNKQDNPRLQRPVSKEYDDQEYHIRRPLREGNHDRQLNRNSAEFGDHGTYHGGMNGGRGSYQKLMRQHQQDRPHSGSYDKGPYFRQNNDGYQRQNSRENDSGRFANRQQQRQNSHEDYQRRESWENDHDHHMHQRNFGGRQNSRENDADYNNRQNFKEKRVKFENSDFEPQAKRKQGGGRGRGSPRKEIQGYDFSSSPQGPPPDPSYNFLADRSRDSFKGDNRNKDQFDRGDRGERGDNGRRHPKNYGGDDFHNVKSRMKRDKEKQDRVRSGPPKSKMEMSINMTGRERRQYVEWKAEREKVDQARIDRQKSSSGEWRREWDVQKDHNDYEDAPSPTRTEPAKRPAGRIGSGRFDRGELDDRQKGPGRPERGQGAKGQGNGLKGEKGEGHHKDGAMKHQNAMRNDKPGHGKDVGSPRQPVGRGRGRGRGWGKPGGNQEVGRIRTSSGDDRVVDLKKDLLVIKLDNTPGKPHDDSVEVEYSDSETSGTNHHGGAPGTTPPKKSGLQTEELWWDEEGDDMGMGLQLDDVLEHTELFEDDSTHDLKYDDEGHLLVGQTSQGDTDEWTDCTSEDFYSTDRSQTSTDADMSSPLRVNVHLNPDAPEFLPSAALPVSPDSNVTPPGKVKVAKWREKERKRAHRSPKVSEGSRTGESEIEDIPQNEEEVREDREKTPRGDNFEDSETVNENFEDAETVNDNDDKSGGVKNSEEDSEVKTESDLSGSTDDKASKEAPTVDNDIVNDMQNLNVKEGQDAESEGDVQNSDTADPSTDSQVKGSDSQADKHPEMDPVVGDKEAGLPNDASVPSKPPSDDGEQKEEENKQEVQEVPTCSENDPKQTAEETEDVTGQEQKSETTDDKQAS